MYTALLTSMALRTTRCGVTSNSQSGNAVHLRIGIPPAALEGTQLVLGAQLSFRIPPSVVKEGQTGPTCCCEVLGRGGRGMQQAVLLMVLNHLCAVLVPSAAVGVSVTPLT